MAEDRVIPEAVKLAAKSLSSQNVAHVYIMEHLQLTKKELEEILEEDKDNNITLGI